MATSAHNRTLEFDDPYPSRTAARPALLPRREPVVCGTAEAGPLAAERLQSYADNGFLTLGGLFADDEIAAWCDELASMRNDPALHAREETITEPGSDEVRSIFAVHALGGLIARLCRDRRIVAIARQILGGDVYFHQTRVNYKPGFKGKPFYWHSDFETWHVEDGMPAMRALSCSIALTPNTPHNGPLMLIPGSHKQFLACIGETPEEHYKQSLKVQEYGVPDHTSLAKMVETGGIVAPTGPAGSVIFFDCNVMHGSNSNITPQPRSNVFIVFNRCDNALVEPYCGLPPRPQFIANRQDFSPIKPNLRR
jgi:ectoine hydroxylase